jgi:hypothetical protein
LSKQIRQTPQGVALYVDDGKTRVFLGYTAYGEGHMPEGGHKPFVFQSEIDSSTADRHTFWPEGVITGEKS